MVDRYTKTILTIIAISLAALAIENAAGPARAQGEGCGGAGNPCYISNYGGLPISVKVAQ